LFEIKPPEKRSLIDASPVDFQHEFLKSYLDYVEDTEPPRVFHVFSAISSVGAALGRRCWLPFGMGQIFPNNYILLVGPPATRKSTAISISKSLLQEATSVRFGPDDTSGARQGLITALAGGIKNPDDDEQESAIKQIFQNIQDPDIMAKLGNVPMVHPADAHVIYVCASEFITFIGINSREFISFLTKMWDGEDHEYRIKNENVWLNDPLLSFLGGATPTTIADAIPPSAIGGGFTSRTLFIYGNKKHKRIAFPKNPPEKKRHGLLNTLKYIHEKLEGPFSLEPSAQAALEALYDYQVKLQDPRFIYYVERRYTHLMKVMMALAAMRGSMVANIDDVQQAHLMLESAEAFMVDALGEYGLSPVSAAKQKMLEVIEHSAPAPVHRSVLHAMMSRDLKPVDFANALLDLQNAGKIHEIPTKYGAAYVYTDKNDKIKEFVDNMVLDHLKVVK
jgi:hypothetical protein